MSAFVYPKDEKCSLSDELVQPDSFSITFSHGDFTILRVSSTTNQLIGYTREELIGHPLIRLIGKDPMQILKSHLNSTSRAEDLKSISCSFCGPHSLLAEHKDHLVEDRSFDMSLVESEGSLVANFKQSLVKPLNPVPILIESIADFMQKIQAVFTVEELLTLSAQGMRSVVNVDRVMIYQFQKAGHVKVVAEDKEPGCRSFLGHCYPSSHLSEHARTAHTTRNFKIFYDIANQPTLEQDPMTREIGNLSLAGMKCMSPAHVKFLDTMDVKFCMSVSIIIDQQLWGLIVYHHHSDQSVTHSIRVSCELLGHIISSKFMNILNLLRHQETESYRSNMATVVDSLIGSDNWKEVLIKEAPNLCRIFNATGLVISLDSQHLMLGETPTLEQIHLLTPYIMKSKINGIFMYDCLLSGHVVEDGSSDVGTGVLALVLSETPEEMIILLRREMPLTLKWLDPSVNCTIVEGLSERWSSIDLHMAHQLERYLLDLKLRYENQEVKRDANMKALIEQQEAIKKTLLYEQEIIKRALTAKEEQISRDLMLEREVTARALAEKEEARQSASIAKTHRKQQALFIDTMCHEIRNPINGIIGTVGVLRDHLASMERRAQPPHHGTTEFLIDDLKQLRECINDIEECANHQRIIANDVLALSTLEQERIRLENTPMNLTSVLKQIFQPYEPIMTKKGVILEVNLFETDIYILGDQNRLKQIICNLLDNAVKFTASGFIRISAVSTGPSDNNQESFEIRIEDSGIGMTQEETQGLFVPYAQANQGISSQYGGTGLGLVVSQELAKLMKGCIVIQSEKGVGTEFKLHFSSQVISLDEYLRLSAPIAVTPRTSSSDTHQINKVLIVEDNLINQKVMVKILQKAGYACDIANNGLQGFDLYKLHKYPIILMDIQMPVMDGLEATRKIREVESEEKWPASYIVCVSGNAREEHRITALSSGVNAYLTKPIKREELLNLINPIDMSPTSPK